MRTENQEYSDEHDDDVREFPLSSNQKHVLSSSDGTRVKPPQTEGPIDAFFTPTDVKNRRKKPTLGN